MTTAAGQFQRIWQIHLITMLTAMLLSAVALGLNLAQSPVVYTLAGQSFIIEPQQARPGTTYFKETTCGWPWTFQRRGDLVFCSDGQWQPKSAEYQMASMPNSLMLDALCCCVLIAIVCAAVEWLARRRRKPSASAFSAAGAYAAAPPTS